MKQTIPIDTVPTTHTMHLFASDFQAVASGKKVYEFRLNDEKRRGILADHFIRFVHYDDPTQTITVRVLARVDAATPEELLAKLPPKSPPHFDSLGLTRFYNPEDITQYGVVGFHIELI